MSQEYKHSRKKARARYTVHPAVIVLGALLILALLGLIALRLLGWSGQKVEGSLTTALVNPYNSVDAAGYTPRLSSVRGVQLDENAAQALETMLSAAESEGCRPLLRAGYLSRAELEQNAALSLEEDSAGFSEHELGLAVDLGDSLTENAGESALLRWLDAHAWQYGFILRYPAGSEESTGVPACPWHLRYVGESAAAQIHELGISLEEYVTLFYNDSAAVVFDK